LRVGHASVTRPAQAEIRSSASARKRRSSSKSATSLALSFWIAVAFGQPSNRDIHIWSPQSRWHSVPWSEPQNAPRSCRRAGSGMRAAAS